MTRTHYQMLMKYCKWIDLYWLPVESRIIYKLMLLTFKALNNLALKYFCLLISIKKPSRSLRSNTSIVLHRKKAMLPSMAKDHSIMLLLNSGTSSPHCSTSRACSRHIFSANDFAFAFVFNFVCFFLSSALWSCDGVR